MEFVLESPVLRWFLGIDWYQLLEIQSPLDFYCNFFPVLSALASSFSVGLLCGRVVGIRPIVIELFIGISASYLFLRYIWFHLFIHFRRLCNENLDLNEEFCRRYVEPGAAAVVAAALTAIARRKSSIEKKTKTKETGSRRVELIGDASQQNSNNSASHDVYPSLGMNPGDDEEILHPFGQLLYCQKCGKVVYESVADPFPPPLAPLKRPAIPQALVMRPGDGSNTRHLRCPHCIELKMNAIGLRGVNSVSFAVGPHSIDSDQTRPKTILRNTN